MTKQDDEIKPKKVLENVMAMINGKSFRCSCGCNVFHHPEPNDKTVYECNACEAWYRGE